jgi:hypothetical protein
MQPRVLHLLACWQMAVILGTMMAVAIKILRIPGPDVQVALKTGGDLFTFVWVRSNQWEVQESRIRL